MDVAAQMKKFMEPKSVAIIGASRTPMAIQEMTLDVFTNLINQGYQHRIYPIHPQASEIQGLKAYASIAQAPQDIDLAIINLPRDLVPGTVKECINKGIKAITIVTQGFADAEDDKGKQLQKEIDDALRWTDTRVLGPNTFGTANAHINFSSSFLAAQMEEIPVGFVCQTGVFFPGFVGLKLIGKAIDLGNGCDIHFSDALEYFEQDVETKVIGLQIEGMKAAKRFLEVASQVARKKPIVALKSGRSEEAAKAALSHTGSLVGKNEIWNAALKQSGVIKVDDIPELGDTVRAFHTLPLIKGRRIGIVTYSGGLGILSIDACQRRGLEAAKLSPATIEQLSAFFPSWQGVSNPVDIWPAIMVTKKASPLEIQKMSAKVLLDDDGVDAVLCIIGAFTPSSEIGLHQLTEEAARSHPDKPLVFCLYGPSVNEAKTKLEDTKRTLVFPSPERAIRALGHLADYSDFRMKL